MDHVLSQTKDSAAEINSPQDSVNKSDLFFDMPPPGTSRLDNHDELDEPSIQNSLPPSPTIELHHSERIRQPPIRYRDETT